VSSRVHRLSPPEPQTTSRARCVTGVGAWPEGCNPTSGFVHRRVAETSRNGSNAPSPADVPVDRKPQLPPLFLRSGVLAARKLAAVGRPGLARLPAHGFLFPAGTRRVHRPGAPPVPLPRRRARGGPLPAAVRGRSHPDGLDAVGVRPGRARANGARPALADPAPGRPAGHRQRRRRTRTPGPGRHDRGSRRPAQRGGPQLVGLQQCKLRGPGHRRIPGGRPRGRLVLRDQWGNVSRRHRRAPVDAH
jgi:hypothetical protein